MDIPTVPIKLEVFANTIELPELGATVEFEITILAYTLDISVTFKVLAPKGLTVIDVEDEQCFIRAISRHHTVLSFLSQTKDYCWVIKDASGCRTSFLQGGHLYSIVQFLVPQKPH